MNGKRQGKKDKAVKLRCFLGLGFPLTDALSPLIDRMGQFAEEPDYRLRLVAPENLHITLKFLGAIEPQQLSAVSALTTKVCQQREPVKIECRGLGFFRQSVWIGISGNPELTALARELDSECRDLGLGEDNKEFIPHVTVARFSKPARPVLSVLKDDFADHDWGGYEASKVNIYRSETLAEGARYTIITSCGFAATGATGGT